MVYWIDYRVANLLGLSSLESLTKRKVKDAYRELEKKYHSDANLNYDIMTAEDFRKITEAKEALEEYIRIERKRKRELKQAQRYGRRLERKQKFLTRFDSFKKRLPFSIEEESEKDMSFSKIEYDAYESFIINMKLISMVPFASGLAIICLLRDKQEKQLERYEKRKTELTEERVAQYQK